MKNTVIIILFIFASNGIVAQYEEPILPNPKRVNFFVAPDYCDRLYFPNNNKPHSEALTKLFDSTFVGRMGYSLGANWLFPLNKHWSFETGVILSNKASQTIVLDSFTSTNQINPLIPLSSHIKYSDYFIDVPLKFNYQLSKNKWTYFVGGGMVLNTLFFDRSVITNTYPNRTEVNSYFSYSSVFALINLSAIVGAGAEYIFNNKFRIRLEPNFQHSILDLRRHTVKVHPYSYGLKIGFCVSL
jgi:hypothetical protein